MTRLTIEQHENSVTIEGTVYDNALFLAFGTGFPNMIGQVLRIDKKENGIVTVTRLPQFENMSDDT